MTDAVNQSPGMNEREGLEPCPFCGGPAGFEEVSMGSRVTWSVGCTSEEADCIGYQVIAHYSRKCEAAEAWNTRAPAPSAWQPIATAPKDGTEILLWGNCHPSNSPARYAKDANVGWWESDHWTTRVGGEQCDALLWMPIPDPCDKYGEPLFLPTALPFPDRGGVG